MQEDLTQRLDKLSVAKRALLEKRLRGERSATTEEIGIPPRSPDERPPLSFGQEQLWFIDQIEPGSPLYNEPVLLFRLEGALNISALQQALTEIIRRHEVLRTTFEERDGLNCQVINPAADLAFNQVDLRELPEADREREVEKLSEEEAWRPFDLGQGPLFRVTLLTLKQQVHVLLISRHHIISDGGSIEILIREFATIYDSFAHGYASPLPELPIQYGDFAAWQNQTLQNKIGPMLDYWRQRMIGPRPEIQLAADSSLSSIRDFSGGRESVVLSKLLTDDLKRLSQQEGCTLFMTLVAAFDVLLMRLSGQEDISIGTPVSRRDRIELQQLIGYFLNTLVLRVDLSGNPSFVEVMHRVREMALGAYAHQDLPFGKLVEVIQPERHPGRNPLFDIWINFRDVPHVPVQMHELTMSPPTLIEPTAKFWLTLYIEDKAGELHLELVYQRALFSEARMKTCLAQFQYLLEQVIRFPQHSIQLYSLAHEGSRKLLPDPSAVLPEPQQQTAPEMFTVWAAQTPHQVALQQGNRGLTYCQLQRDAYALVRQLQVRGFQKGEVVAIYGPKGIELVTSMMAVLLSGGVHITLDPNLPIHRRKLMLEKAGARWLVVVCDSQVFDELWWQDIPSVLVIHVRPHTGTHDESEEEIGVKPDSLPMIHADDAAYIFFTSGTTGIPKGVLGSHKGLSHFLNWQRETFAVGPQDRVAQLTGLSFDVLLRDVYLPLTSGATLCLPEEDEDVGSGHVFTWLEDQSITHLHTVPSLAQSWLREVPAGVSLTALRRVFFAGEPLTDSLIRRWRQAFQNVGDLINLYGPTETTLAKCFYRIPSKVCDGIQPIGSTLPQTQALILSRHNLLCGIGEPGEIVLRTPFRSLGYVNAVEDSCSRFVKNPFRDDDDVVYRTGDLGRYRPDGLIDILGRIDHQVKIRGVRVEPEEIAVCLEQHSCIREAFVMARQDISDALRLVAYAIPDKGSTLESIELREYIRERLPEFMVPSAYVFLEEFPLTLNGKVDRRALPEPEEPSSEDSYESACPSTYMECLMADIWKEELGVSQVSIYDNFFDMGGHSLLSMRVIAKLEKRIGLRLNPRELMYQSLGQLASSCEERKAAVRPTKASASVLQRFVDLLRR